MGGSNQREVLSSLCCDEKGGLQADVIFVMVWAQMGWDGMGCNCTKRWAVFMNQYPPTGSSQCDVHMHDRFIPMYAASFVYCITQCVAWEPDLLNLLVHSTVAGPALDTVAGPQAWIFRCIHA